MSDDSAERVFIAALHDNDQRAWSKLRSARHQADDKRVFFSLMVVVSIMCFVIAVASLWFDQVVALAAALSSASALYLGTFVEIYRDAQRR